MKLPQFSSLAQDQMNRLLSLYRDYSDKEPYANGVGALLVRDNHSNNSLFSFPSKDANFERLPLEVQLQILSYLSPTDICSASKVSRRWYEVCSNEVVWKPLLTKEMSSWTRISSDKNPDECQTAMSSHDIYQKCCPDQPSGSKISTLLQYISNGISHTPKIVMFGPGLDTKTSKVVRSIITDEQMNDVKPVSKFFVTGMVPGASPGVGSGLSVKFYPFNFDLVTLYSNCKNLRQRHTGQNRIQHSRLFLQDSQSYEVSPPIQELCRQSQGFVFIVDAKQSLSDISASIPELNSMLCESWAPNNIPLLILAATRNSVDPDVKPHSLMTIVRALKLGRLRRKWLIQSGEVETLEGVRDGFNWLLSET